MKGEEFLENMDLIDEKLVQETVLNGQSVNIQRKKILIVSLSVAAVLLAACTVVGIVLIHHSQEEIWGTKIIYHDGEGVNESTTETIGNGETTQNSYGETLAETKDSARDGEIFNETVSKITGDGDTTNDLYAERPWEKMPLSERYREFDYQGRTYSVRAVVSADRAGEKLADVNVKGEHPFTGEVHETAAELFRFNAYTEEAAVLIRFSESPDYYAAADLFYAPKTLGDFLEGINAEETLLVPGYTDYLWYDTENQAHRIVFEGFTKEYLMSYLMKYADAPGEDMMSMLQKGRANNISYMTCRVGEVEFNRPNASFWFTRTGYLSTNLIDAGYSFYVGEEAVQQFEQYLKENLQEFEYVHEANPEAGTTEEEGAEPGFETSQSEGAGTVEE